MIAYFTVFVKHVTRQTCPTIKTLSTIFTNKWGAFLMYQFMIFQLKSCETFLPTYLTFKWLHSFRKWDAMAEVAMKMDVEKIWFFCLVTTNITPFQYFFFLTNGQCTNNIL